MALKIKRSDAWTRDGDAALAVQDRVSWGAIFAGAVAALALQLLFSLMTAGLGLELMDDGDASGAGWGTGIFFALTAIASMFAGGSIAGRLSGVPFMPSAVLHGVVVWALVMISVTWLSVSATGAILRGATQAVSTAGSAVGAVAGGAAQVAGNAAQGLGGALSSITPDAERFSLPELDSLVPPSVERDLEQALGTEELSAMQLRQEVNAISDEIIDGGDIRQARRIAADAARRMLANPAQSGEILQQAIDEMTAPDGPLGEQQFDELQGILQERYGISEEQSAEFVERWRTEFVEARDAAIESYRQGYESIAQELDDAAQAAADAARAAADAAASAAWWTAVGSFVGLLAAAIGAAVGRPEDIEHEAVTRPTTPRT